MKAPTKKQTLLLNFIEKFTAEHNFSPSYREIMHAMRLRSVSAVAEHVENCITAGFLKKVPRSARSLELIQQKTYAETKELFTQKIYELKQIDPRSSDLDILTTAAKILKLDIKL